MMDAMTWEQVLNRAIAKEHEANSNYRALAKRVNHPGSQQMLIELAEEERKHKEILEHWRAEGVKGPSPASLPSLDVVREGQDVRFAKDLTPEETVRMAIQEEQRAFAFYEQLANGLNEAQVRDLAEQLAAEERKHALRLQGLLEEEIFREM